LNDLEFFKIKVLVIVLQFSAAAHTLTVICNEIDGDRLGQSAN